MKLIFHALTIITICSVAGCAKLDGVPEGTYTTDNFYRTEEDAISAVNAVYSGMTSPYLYNQFMEVIQSQGTDDCEWGYGRNTRNTDKNVLDKFTYDAGTNLFFQFWSTSYQVINRANAAIDNIAAMTSINDDKKQQYQGEAKFVRALMYFNLVRLFGGVPLQLSATTSLKDLAIKRAGAEEVYAQIIADLQFCGEHLPLSNSAANAGRATKGGAMALLVKVFLTRRNYPQAVEEARKVMALGSYSLWPAYREVFEIANENRTESIFEVQFISGSGNIGSSYAGYYRPAFDKRPGFGGFGDNPVTENHYKAYPPGDLRRDINVIQYSYTSDPKAPTTIKYPYYVAKYKDPAAIGVDDGGNNYIILRYADVLLMFAEALYLSDPGNAEALEAFNQVRRRAYGLPVNAPSAHDLAPGLSAAAFQDSLLLERRLEFAFEGQRRFDLLRTGKLQEAMQAQDASITVRDQDTLFPIPTQEMDANPLLEQNPGY
ncbi:RagB/SusD family nutrient uptake outer membrane protein [Chitinophaga japonensis]|uniref:RagB/SusD domain-containing protein n=1 Tax=Chitinophaga japonensis TaxID=104662 RepID=A0A562T3X0_CHIJA|nr:RagB/SusD family nutrient uptake outer membrane protein [Chitinophaga japonensis]TWI88245.1 RagB/SusD domain-containing protein [Chitinophaga japonensis]